MMYFENNLFDILYLYYVEHKLILLYKQEFIEIIR